MTDLCGIHNSEELSESQSVKEGTGITVFFLLIKLLKLSASKSLHIWMVKDCYPVLEHPDFKFVIMYYMAAYREYT